jgi:PhnB protein
MSIVDEDLPLSATMATPDIYPRLAYRDELAAVDYLTRVFGFVENREARLEFDAKYLCWLRVGTGVAMVTHENADVHDIHSPLTAGLTTVIVHVYVHDIDTQYARAVEAGADITMPLVDAFYGDRVYEATDPEGHRWHFGERFANILARGGRLPAPPEPQ